MPDFDSNREIYQQLYLETPKVESKYRGTWGQGIPKYNWDEISKEYIRGVEIVDPFTQEKVRMFPTLRDVATKYGCNFDYMYDSIASKDKWGLQRTQFLRALREQESEIDLQDILGTSAKLDAQYLQALENINNITNAILEPWAQEALHPGTIDTSDLRPLTTTDLRNIVTTLQNSHTLATNITRRKAETSDKAKSLKAQSIGDITSSPNSGNNLKSANPNKIKALTNQLMEAERLKEELAAKRALLKQHQSPQTDDRPPTVS